MERKLIGNRAARVETEFTSFISNEDMNYTIKIINSLKNSNVLIDGITETVNREIKKRRQISFCFVRTFGHFNCGISDLLSSNS